MVLSERSRSTSIRIMLLDSDEIVRKGIRSLLESDPDFTVVADAGDSVEALKKLEHLRPDVIVLELMLKGVSGLELIQNLGTCSAETRVVVLSRYGSEVYVMESLRAGALAYVLKDSNVEELFTAVHRVAAGHIFLSSSLAQHAFDIYSSRGNNNHNGDSSAHGNNNNGNEDSYNTLSSRERQVLHLIVQEELTNSTIADRLCISRRTVESHRANVMKKLGLNSYPGLVRYGIQKGLLPPPAGERVPAFNTSGRSYATLNR